MPPQDDRKYDIRLSGLQLVQCPEIVCGPLSYYYIFNVNNLVDLSIFTGWNFRNGLRDSRAYAYAYLMRYRYECRYRRKKSATAKGGTIRAPATAT